MSLGMSSPISPEATACALPEAPDAMATSLASAAPRQTIRVLHLVNGEHYSGAERVLDLRASNRAAFLWSAKVRKRRWWRCPCAGGSTCVW
jgi:hypothetical protein